MGSDAIKLFRSSGRSGYSKIVSDDPNMVRARKLAREVHVRFAESECTVQTQEGLVHAKSGDAILTGGAGEHWRVSRARFADKYEPVAPTLAWHAGRYRSLPNRIIALQMNGPFAVLLADGESRLGGQAGDWLVDYGDGSLGVVAPAIFTTTYEILG